MDTVVILLIYGLVVEAGGVIAYVKTKSRASLIASAVLGTLLIVSGGLILMGIPAGSYVGFAATLTLISIFGIRYRKTGRFVPAGFMLALSVIVAGVLFAMLFVSEM